MATREQKQETIEELRGFFQNAQVAIVADLTGLSVAEITGLRRKLDGNRAVCRIAKNTLIKVATGGSAFEPLKELAVGPTAIVAGYEEAAAPAKTICEFLKALKKGSIRGGVMEGRTLSEDDVQFLASLPGKDELLASIMGGLDSGARSIAGILESLVRDIALLAEAVAQKNNPQEI